MNGAADEPAWWADAVVPVLAGLRSAADPERAVAMRAYMRDRFPFLGVGSPERRRLTAALRAATRGWDQRTLLACAQRLWELDEREHAYVACDLLRARERHLDAAALAPLRKLVVTRSWWDTVDPLSGVVGSVVARHPELVAAMDDWAGDADHWVARVAILHQLGRKERTDLDRLFRTCALRATDEEFFIRKAIGWALRDAARARPEEVRAFVDAHPELSGLSKREALKHLHG